MLPIHKALPDTYDYDAIPAGYYFNAMQEGPRIQRFWHQKKFQEIAKRIHPNERVLDFGCGPGSFLWMLNQRHLNIHCTGIDIAGSQLDFARNICKSFPSTSFVGINTDNIRLPFDDNSFDVVTMIEVIEHIHPYKAYKILAELRRVLKKNGRLLITTPNYRSLWPLIEALMTKFTKVKYDHQHISKFTPNAFAKLIEAAGFEIKSFYTIFIFAPFISSFSQWFSNFLHHIERKFPLRAGSILVAEGNVSNMDSHIEP